MVTLAEELNTLYPVDNNKPIFLKGFVSGNYGEFNRSWLNTTSANIKPGMGLLRATAGAEHTCTEWGAACEVGYGVSGFDKSQILTQQTTYASADLIPVYEFHRNPGAIFQAYFTDSLADIDGDGPLTAGAAGIFTTGDLSVKIYARMLYFVADTTGSYDNVLTVYIAPGGMGG